MADNDTLQDLLSGTEATVAVPGSYDSVHINRLERTGTTYRVWVNGNTQASPDFVIVNPPTQIINNLGKIEENPLGAIALAIYGAMR